MSAQDRLNQYIQLDHEKTKAQIEANSIKKLLAQSQAELEAKCELLTDAVDRIEEYRQLLKELYDELPATGKKKLDLKIKRLME